MNTKINNVDELKIEIARLKRLQSEQEFYLGAQYTLLRKKIEMPSRVIGAITSSIPGFNMMRWLVSSVSSTKGGHEKKESGSDWLTRTLQFGLPLVLNTTFLKKSGWLKKYLVLLASETAAGQINQNSIASAISKVTEFIKPKKKKKKYKGVPPLEEEQDTVNFGIPPDSETY